MMKLTTPVTEFDDTLRIEPRHHLLVLGSCFAGVVGKRLADYRLHVLFHPPGTLYNPASIFDLIEAALDIAEGRTSAGEKAREHLFEGNDGRWHSWMASSATDGATRQECLHTMTGALEQVAEMTRSLDVLILTFGTDHCYTLAHDPGTTVANCHKMPAAMFGEKVLDGAYMPRRLATIYPRLKALRPDVGVIMTVSPYRYLKYGLHQSQLSKARLLTGIDQCQRQWPEICYFPAYEIVNDELRDYRFYAADMVHPSETAEEYIWQSFRQHYIGERLNQFFDDWDPILKAQGHRPLTNDPETILRMRQDIEKKTEALRRRYPDILQA